MAYLILALAAFLGLWGALIYFVIWPKRAQYLAAMQIDTTAFRESLWSKIVLKLRGAKVAIMAFLVSAIPMIDVIYTADWTKLQSFKLHDVVTFVFSTLVLPMAMAWLHQTSLATAASTDPAK